MGYTVEKALSIPGRLLDVPVIPQILEAYGFDPTTPQDTIKLAQVVLNAGSYGGKWHVTASAITEEPGKLESVGAIWCDDGTKRDEVLTVADCWIRESDTAIFVPGSPWEIPIEDETYARFAVSGITLVRASEIES